MVVAYWLWHMQLSIFHLQDQPVLMVKYDLVTETLLTDLLHVQWILALAICFPTATSDGVRCLLLLTKGGILAVTLFCVLDYKSICCWTCTCFWYVTNRTTFGTNNNLFDSVMTFISAVSLILSFRVWWSLNPLLSTFLNPFNFIKITWEVRMFVWQCLLRCWPINQWF